MVVKRRRQDDCLYIQFARAPQAGRVKTRMQPRLGPQAACELHCELLEYTALQLQRLPETPRELWIAGDATQPWLSGIAAHYGMALRRQRGADLGERMLYALRDGLARYRHVVLVGSDCPGLDSGYLREAATLLRQRDMVWGPAADGGYVLVGASRAHAACFRGVDWGSAIVMSQSLACAQKRGIPFATLPVRHDIDRPEDLGRWLPLRERWRGAEQGSADAGGPVAHALRRCAGAD